jgi:predicted 3-demethylubiquinone-9 3-methyltransferase (glyoxalase superfamily)
VSKIAPFLWFDTQAEEAMNFYVSVFRDAKAGKIMQAGPGGPVLTVEFELAGQRFIGLNGGPQFRFNEAVSLFINCEDQAEVDELWAKLTADGGAEGRCGWLKDRFGVSWQVIPRALAEALGDPDRDRAQRAMQAMMGMGKIDVEGLRRAADGLPVAA